MRLLNRVASWALALSIAGLLFAENHARSHWRDRAIEAEANLAQVRHFLALERAHVKELCAAEDNLLSGGVK